nr:hypothetical protein BaRGS_016841 [Batillaria attramentaria]
MTSRLRLRLSCEESDIDANQPASARRNNNASLLGSREITPDSSRQHNATSEDAASNNAQDSGAFSGDNTGKSNEAPDSQRSEKQVGFGAAVTGSGAVKTGSDDVQDYLQNHAHHSDSDDNSQADEMFGSYHHYRALLDEEEADGQQEEEEQDDEDGSNVVTITPRRINDVSGMLREFAQHPGTLPSIFSSTGPLAGQSAGAAFLQTWPNLPQQGRGLEKENRRRKDSKTEEMGEEERGEVTDEDTETPQFQPQAEGGLHDRNSFVDSWLENSAEHEHDTLTTSKTGPARTDTYSDDRTFVQPFELEVEDSEEGDTPRASGHQEAESEQQEAESEHQEEEHESKPKMRLLSNVELIDSLTSIRSGPHKRTQRRTDVIVVQNRLSSSRQTEPHPAPGNVENSFEFPSGDGPHDRHLLSNVELYSTVSSYHPAARHPRHLLSNVELASTASGSSHHPDSASSRPSRQSSANSAGRHHDLEVCEEEEDVDVDNDDADEPGTQQPASARSQEVSDFFAAEAAARSNGQRVVNGGGYDSSDEEHVEYQYSAGARAAAVKSRATAGKPRDVSHSLTCASDRTVTEDSGLESGAKSSQDERDGMSLMDSTHGHHPSLHGAAAPVPEFFLPVDQLQASMRALQLATSAASQTEQDGQVSRSAGKAKASSDLIQRLKASKSAAKFNGTISTKGRQLPTAEEAKRIAKIFSSKVP